VDDGLLAHQILLPLLENLNQGIEFLVIGRVVENFPMKYFRMIAYKPSSLHQNYSHIPLASVSTSKGLHKFVNERNNA
jgi:hypothetical protein